MDSPANGSPTPAKKKMHLRDYIGGNRVRFATEKLS
jgi:hypothetical protein